MEILHTNGKNKDFVLLCSLLDNSLDELSGGNENRKQYEQYNQLDDIHDVVLIYIDSQPVGCAGFKEISEGTAEVKRVFVKKEHRGRGISKILMKEIEQKAKEKGYRRTVLETGRHLESANGLYKSIGYKVIENYGQYKGMDRSICFEKVL